MQIPTRFPTAPLLALALGLTAPTGAAREIAVTPDPNARPVLAQAIRDAAEGDTLVLGKGVYRETVAIDKPIHVKLEGGEPLHGKPLPGCEANGFKGKAPDLGAFEAE